MVKEKLEKWIKETLGVDRDVVLVHPAHTENGDFTFITDPKLASEYAEKLNFNKIVEVSKVVFASPRFINIYLSGEFFANSLNEVLEKQDNFGKNEVLKGEKIFFEHTQPNPFKEFHIGHLMNNAIGESVSRILMANGAELKVATYHGDKGLHVAKAIWGIKNNSELKNLGEAYTLGNKAYEESEQVKGEIIEINKKVYDRSDSDINKIYDDGRKKSFDYFESLYERLDSHFDFHFYESESGEVGKKLVGENMGRVFVESEGATVFKGEEFVPKTHTRVFLTKDGLPTYEAKELGLAEMKKEKWPYTNTVTVTANEQDAFFSVVEVAIGEVFPELRGKLKHLSHGILKLPSGKMSSRTGDVITATSLIDEVKGKILDKIKDRGFSSEEQQEIAGVVAIGAIKYTILRQAVGGDIIFDFDKSISFEGDSGPYLQYTYVRAKSILEKANVSKMPFDTIVGKLENWETKEVEKILYRFPEVVEKVGLEYSPHYLVTYLIELAGAFNSFYANEKIVDESDPNSPYKLALTQSVSIVLKNGLYLLGIKVPERM